VVLDGDLRNLFAGSLVLIHVARRSHPEERGHRHAAPAPDALEGGAADESLRRVEHLLRADDERDFDVAGLDGLNGVSEGVTAGGAGVDDLGCWLLEETRGVCDGGPEDPSFAMSSVPYQIESISAVELMP